MTKGELIRTKTFQGLPRAEQQAMLRDINAGTLDLSAAPTPHPDEMVTERNAFGILPNQEVEPQQTGSVGETFMRPVRESLTDPTFTEQLLPESFATRALSGVERGARMVGGVLQGGKNVIEQGIEQLPRVWGGEPTSTPVSRVLPDVPELVAQAKMPVTGRGLTRETPRRFVQGVKEAVTGVRNVATDAAARLRDEAAQLGIDLTRSESLAGTKRGKVYRMGEAVTEATPTGGPHLIDYKERQRAQARKAVEEAAEMIHPGPVTREGAALPANEVANRRVRATAEAEAERQAAKAAQEGSVAGTQVSDYTATLGPVDDPAAFVTATKKKLSDVETEVRREGSGYYKDAERLAGDNPIVALHNVSSETTDLLTRQGRLGRLRQQPSSGVAAEMRNMAVEFIEEYGLEQVQFIDYPTARLLDEILGDKIEMAKRAGAGSVKRQLVLLQKALRKDLDDVAVATQGDLGAAMRKANAFHATRVAEPFGPDSAIAKLHGTDAVHEFDKLLFNPHGAEQIAKIRAEMTRLDPDAWRAVEARFGQQLLQQAFDPVTGHFDPKAFSRNLKQYPPEALTAILGDRATGVNQLRERFQRAAAGAKDIDDPLQAAAIFREFAKENTDIIGGLAKQPLDRLREIKAAMRPEDWPKMGRAWWENVVFKNSLGNTNVFSRERFLTQLKGVSDDHLKVLIGDDAGERVSMLRRVLQEQEKVNKLGDNPPGTAKLLLMGRGFVQAGLLAGALFTGNVAGITAAGASVVTPFLAARLLTHPKGSQLMLDVARSIEGTQAATQASKRLAIFIAQMQNQQEAEWGPPEGRTP